MKHHPMKRLLTSYQTLRLKTVGDAVRSFPLALFVIVMLFLPARVHSLQQDEGDLFVDVVELYIPVAVGDYSEEQPFTISNLGDFPIEWEIEVEDEYGDDPYWLELSADEGLLEYFDDAQTVYVAVDAATLDVGQYEAAIFVIDVETEEEVMIRIFVDVFDAEDVIDEDPFPDEESDPNEIDEEFEELFPDESLDPDEIDEEPFTGQNSDAAEFEGFTFSRDGEMAVDVEILEFSALPGGESETLSITLYNWSDEQIQWDIVAEEDDGEEVDDLLIYAETETLLDESTTIDFMVDASELDEDVYTAIVTIWNVNTSDAIYLPAVLYVVPTLAELELEHEDDLAPTIFADPFLLDFTFDPNNLGPISQTFTITTTEPLPREVFVVEADDWVTVEPEYGDVAPDSAQTITVTVDPTSLSSGLYLSEIDVLDTESLYFETILLNVEVRGDATTEIRPTALSFEIIEGQISTDIKTLTVAVAGTAVAGTATVAGTEADALEWYAYGLEEWLVLAYDEQDPTKLHVSMASQQLPAGDYTDTIFVESTGGTVEIPVRLEVESTAQASQQRPLPNLKISELRLEPPNPRPGQSVTVVATIVNDGNLAIEDTFYVDLFFNPAQRIRGGFDWKAIPTNLNPPQGIEWSVRPNRLPARKLLPGGTVTLRSEPNPGLCSSRAVVCQSVRKTRWSGSFSAEAARLVLSVDSYQRFAQPNGRIVERQEQDNRKTLPLRSGPDGGTGTTELEVYGIEVTQAVQDLRNSVPLIAKKPTFVRGHVRSLNEIRVRNVQARLVGTKDGQPLAGSPLTPSNDGAMIDVLDDPYRIVRNDAFLFALPDQWSEKGEITLKLEVIDHPTTCAERGEGRANQDCQVTVAFEETPPLPVRFIDIQWTDSNGQHTLPNDAIEKHKKELVAQFPIASLTVVTPTFPLQVSFNPAGMNTRSSRKESKFLKKVLDDHINRLHVQDPSYIYYYGLAADLTKNAGWGYIPSDTNYSYFTGSGDANDAGLIVHEFGHMNGLYHVRCNRREKKPDRSYPNPFGRISASSDPESADTYYGFHIFTQEIAPPTAGDIMSYCPLTWVSGHTYERLLSTIRRRDTLWQSSLAATSTASAGSTGSNGAAASMAAEELLLVQGELLEDGQAAIFNVQPIDEPESTPTTEAGDYTIRTEDAAGRVIDSISINPVAIDGGGETFGALVPDAPEIEHVVLLRGNQELARFAISATPPEIRLLSPNSGANIQRTETTIEWTASDRDGDDLFFYIDYSLDDGQTWQLLSTGIAGDGASVETHRTTIDFSRVPGAAQARLQVRASDGYHMSRDSLPFSFQVPNAPPEAVITTASGDRYIADQLVLLDGVGFDLEDGVLNGSSLTWSSTHDGRLGTGSRLNLEANQLSEGQHTITLTARDSAGATTVESIMLTIDRSRELLAAELVVYPPILQAVVALGDDFAVVEEVRIDNDGDNGLVWSAQANQPWIELSATEGLAPSDIQIRVNPAKFPADLQPGEQTGSVTFTDTLSELQEVLFVELYIVDQ